MVNQTDLRVRGATVSGRVCDCALTILSVFPPPLVVLHTLSTTDCVIVFPLLRYVLSWFGENVLDVVDVTVHYLFSSRMWIVSIYRGYVHTSIVSVVMNCYRGFVWLVSIEKPEVYSCPVSHSGSWVTLPVPLRAMVVEFAVLVQAVCCISTKWCEYLCWRGYWLVMVLYQPVVQLLT